MTLTLADGISIFTSDGKANPTKLVLDCPVNPFGDEPFKSAREGNEKYSRLGLEEMSKIDAPDPGESNSTNANNGIEMFVKRLLALMNTPYVPGPPAVTVASIGNEISSRF